MLGRGKGRGFEISIRSFQRLFLPVSVTFVPNFNSKSQLLPFPSRENLQNFDVKNMGVAFGCGL